MQANDFENGSNANELHSFVDGRHLREPEGDMLQSCMEGPKITKLEGHVRTKALTICPY